MKHKLLPATLILALLCGCALGLSVEPAGSAATPAAPTASPSGGPVGGPPWVMTCRIVDGAEDGNLLLAENGGGPGAVYRLDVSDLELMEPLRDGMLLNIFFESVMETYPAQFASVSGVEPAGRDPDDRCGLYLQVLEDLWEVDPGLNSGITELGVDLSGVTDLSGAEKSAVAWHFGELHGLTPIEGTWEELCEQGYIDKEHLIWEEGCLFSITGGTEAFDAEKWASGLGAYFFMDCAGSQSGGAWSYDIGGEAIS